MFDWTLLWGAGAVVASVLIARWYGRSWRALAEALAEGERGGSRSSPDEDGVEGGVEDRAGRGERVGSR